MGEARTKVRLTNATDLVLARRGQITPEQVRTYEADALIDTGAVCTVIPSHVMQLLGLEVREDRVAEYADGRRDVVGVTDPMLIEIDQRNTMDEALVLGDEVLIGQTVLEKTDLLVDCARRRVIRNPAHPDQPVLKVK